ncbi:AAA family ATPase [Streptomyces sp. SAS_275]|uniref:AAA family ATPase n=1 Tax=Streptomyces sp. SAS_275 TaxID=3412746 RepID=UPI00403CD463
MRISSIHANRFMSFSRIDLPLEAGTTVVTGPNAVGKSNLGRIIDVVRLVVEAHAGSQRSDRLDAYARAPRRGGRRFRLILGIELDQPWEQDLVATFVRAVYASSSTEEPPTATRLNVSPERRDQDARRRLDPKSVSLLLQGFIVVSYDEGAQPRWSAFWQHSATGEPFPEDEPVWIMDLRNGGPVMRSEGTPVMTFPLVEAWRRVFPDDEIGIRPQGPEIDFMRILTQTEHSVGLSTTLDSVMPLLDSVRDLHMLLGWDTEEAHRRQVSFVHVLDVILRRGIVLTDNRRLPLERAFPLHTLRQQADLEDGSRVPAELYRLKNGPLPLRQRYQRIQDRFEELVGAGFEVQAQPGPEGSEHLLIDVTVPEGDYEYPVAFSGAGRQEALFLSTVLVGDPGRIIVLDEPGVHIEPTLQRRLTRAADNTSQCLVITHSPDLVPVAASGDLARIVRLAPTSGGSTAHRIGRLDTADEARLLQALGPRDVRALLFCAGAVLCEGSTETGALATWWENSSRPPSSANIALIDAGGDKAFGRYIQFLQAFNIPWAVIADGPALHPGSHLHQQLTALGLLPATQPDSAAPNFGEWKAFWQDNAVLTVADTFGNDGTQAGEFEAYLKRRDPHLLDRLRKGRSKPRVGTAFAQEHPLPQEIAHLYQLVLDRLSAS